MQGRDYELSYQHNISGGMLRDPNSQASQLIKGIGNYQGEQRHAFNILDQEAPRFDTQGAREGGASLRISVTDNWGLQRVQVLRGGYPVYDQTLSATTPERQRLLSYTFMRPGSYQVIATDLYGHERQLYERARYFADSDGDGLSDAYETAAGLDRHNPDTDGDSLSDGDEVLKHRTDPLKADSQGQGIRDDITVQLRQLWGRQATSQSLSLRLLLGSGATPAGPRPELTALADKGLLHSLQAVNDTDIHFQPEQSQLVARDSQGGWLAMQGSLLLRLEKARGGSLQPAQAIDLSALRDVVTDLAAGVRRGQ